MGYAINYKEWATGWNSNAVEIRNGKVVAIATDKKKSQVTILLPKEGAYEISQSLKPLLASAGICHVNTGGYLSMPDGAEYTSIQFADKMDSFTPATREQKGRILKALMTVGLLSQTEAANAAVAWGMTLPLSEAEQRREDFIAKVRGMNEEDFAKLERTAAQFFAEGAARFVGTGEGRTKA